VTPEETPQDAELEKVSGDLIDSLKSCRSVLNDYRAILSSPATTGASADSLASDGRQ